MSLFFSPLLGRHSFSMDKTIIKKGRNFHEDLAGLYSMHFEDVIGNCPGGNER
jgi:hypothetical protein